MARAWRLAVRVHFTDGEIKPKGGVKDDTRRVSVHFD